MRRESGFRLDGPQWTLDYVRSAIHLLGESTPKITPDFLQSVRAASSVAEFCRLLLVLEAAIPAGAMKRSWQIRLGFDPLGAAGPAMTKPASPTRPPPGRGRGRGRGQPGNRNGGRLRGRGRPKMTDGEKADRRKQKDEEMLLKDLVASAEVRHEALLAGLLAAIFAALLLPFHCLSTPFPLPFHSFSTAFSLPFLDLSQVRQEVTTTRSGRRSVSVPPRALSAFTMHTAPVQSSTIPSQVTMAAVAAADAPDVPTEAEKKNKSDQDKVAKNLALSEKRNAPLGCFVPQAKPKKKIHYTRKKVRPGWSWDRRFARGAWSGTPIWDTSYSCHPLNWCPIFAFRTTQGSPRGSRRRMPAGSPATRCGQSTASSTSASGTRPTTPAPSRLFGRTGWRRSTVRRQFRRWRWRPSCFSPPRTWPRFP